MKNYTNLKLNEETDAQIERRIHYEVERLAYYRSKEEALAQGLSRGAAIGSMAYGATHLLRKGEKGTADSIGKGLFVGAALGAIAVAAKREIDTIRERKKMLRDELTQQNLSPEHIKKFKSLIKELTLKELVTMNRFREEKIKQLKLKQKTKSK